MSATKSTTVLQNNLTMSGGGGPTTSTAQTLATSFGASLFLKNTNGATAPTTSAKMVIEVSPDGTNYYEMNGGSDDLDGGTVNNAVVSKHFDIPIGIQTVRVVVTHGDDQDVTVRSEVSEVTAVA